MVWSPPRLSTVVPSARTPVTAVSICCTASFRSNGFTATSPASATCSTPNGGHVLSRVIWPEQLRGGPDVAGSEAGPGPVADSGVERDAEHRNIGSGDLVDPREPGERGRCGPQTATNRPTCFAHAYGPEGSSRCVRGQRE
jgi:hypothetical protein